MEATRTGNRAYIECSRKGYLYNDVLGTGIVRAGSEMPLAVGIYYHHVVARLLGGGDLEEAIDDAKGEFKCVQDDPHFGCMAHLVECMCRGFQLIKLPEILDEFEVVEIEREHKLPLDFLTIPTRMDVVVRKKSTGRLWCLESKTTSTNKQEYFQKWNYDMQMLMQMWAIEEIYNESPEGVLLQFAYKGMKSWAKDKEQIPWNSPFTKAWYKAGTPPFDKDEYAFDYTRKKDWHPINVWDHFTAAEWIKKLPVDVLVAQYPKSLPIYYDPNRVGAWKKNFLSREARRMEGLNALKDLELGTSEHEQALVEHFPGNMDESCYQNKYNRSCQYLDVCFGPYFDVRDAMASGEFVEREDHHK